MLDSHVLYIYASEPYLAEDASHLYLFQRTTSSRSLTCAITVPQIGTGLATLPNGWQDDRQKNFDSVLEGDEAEIECWSNTNGQRFGDVASVRGGGKDVASQMRECTPG